MKDNLSKFEKYILKNKNIDYHKEKGNIRNSLVPEDMLLDDINFIRDITGINIVDKDFNYFSISSDSLCWSFTDAANQFIYGGFIVNGYLETLAQDSDFWDIYNSVNRHEPDEEELEFLKKLNWFEKQAWGDDGKFGCFLREPGDFPPPIYFYDYGALYPMRLTLEEYFNGMIASCGVRGWQYFYLDYSKIEIPDLPKVNKELIVKDLAFIVKMLPALFPDNDFSFHINKLEEIKKIL